MSKRVPALALALMLVLAQGLHALPQRLEVIGFEWILAPAVMQTEKGYAGTSTNVTVLVTEGWGDVYVSTYSLTQEDFQGAATAASRVVCSLLNLSFSKYNFYFKVVGPAVIVGGPSAGIAMAVAVYSALTGQPINRSVMVTGMVSPDGTVGPVGGVYEKAQATASLGAKLFLVPPGQSVVTTYRTVERRIGPFRLYTTEPVTVNLTEVAKRQWGLTVKEISTLREAINYFFGVDVPTQAPSRVELSPEALSLVTSIRDELLSSARNELSITENYLNSSQLSRLAKSLLNRYLASARSYLSSGEASRYIESIPTLTYSIATSRWVRMLVDYYTGISLDQYTSSVESRLREALSGIARREPFNALQLNRLVLAADLVVRAARLYNASASAWSDSPETALQYLAYSSAFMDEADLWLRGVEGGRPLDASHVAQTYLSVARTTWSYAYSILSQTGSSSLLNIANTYYTTAVSFYSSSRHLLAAVAAAKCVATAEAALLSFQASVTGSDVYLKTSREQALRTASGIRDLLTAVYFLNFSNTASSTEEALAWLKHSTHLGTLTVELSKNLGTAVESRIENEENRQPPAETPPPQPEKPRTDWIGKLLDFFKRVWEALGDFFKRLAEFFQDAYRR
ncbi:MAG: hypothetical protein NZ954_04295 [Thermofilaceae archaeon]|nr:hypothetical protein [Thermofilaceae archaeon]MCX8180037.1 hypothetical protein [Thermofilaceae archaeon]MDW8003220.1 S16 family serine protease [Thermofilaceae archaeon]